NGPASWRSGDDLQKSTGHAYRRSVHVEDYIVLRGADHSVPRSSTQPAIHVGVQASPPGLAWRRSHPLTTPRPIGATILGDCSCALKYCISATAVCSVVRHVCHVTAGAGARVGCSVSTAAVRGLI